MEPKELLGCMPALMRTWLHALGVPNGAEGLRVVFDSHQAHVTYSLHGLKTRHVVPMPLVGRSRDDT